MDLEKLSQIAGALGLVTAAASLVAGFRLYQIGKRDDYTAKVRAVIAESRNVFSRLNDILTFELANDLTRAVVYSKDLKLLFDGVFERFFKDEEETANAQELRAYLDDRLDPITVPINVHTAEAYEDLLHGLTPDIARYQTEFPGLYRVLNSLALHFRNLLHNHKHLARDEELFKNVLIDLIFGQQEERGRVVSAEALRNRMHVMLTGASLFKIVKSDRENVTDLLTILDLVADGYLAMDDRKLMSASRRERRMSFIPVSKTDKITDDLREAEKALKAVLPTEALLDYRQHVTQYMQRQGAADT